MYEKYEVRVQLRETKPDGKVRKKFTRKLINLYKVDELKTAFEEMIDRSKHNLFLSIYELDENNKAKKKPILEKEIFPQENIGYVDLIKDLDSTSLWFDRIGVRKKFKPLFEYFIKTESLDIKKDFHLEEVDEEYSYYRYYPRTLDSDRWKLFRKKWEDFEGWKNLKNNIIRALSDPTTEHPELFQTLLEDHKIIDKVLITAEDHTWEVRQSSKNGSLLLFNKDGASVELTAIQLQKMVSALEEEHIIGR